MKLRSVWLLFPLFGFSTALIAQTVIPPPVKMGLWQSEATTEASGAANSPMAQALSNGGHTTVSQGCLTPETWKKELEGLERQRTGDCSMSNFQQTSHKLSFDEQCGGDRGYSNTAHVEMFIDDAENAHGHADMKMVGPAFPQGMTIHVTMKSKYLSSDCGDVKPGEGKVLR